MTISAKSGSLSLHRCTSSVAVVEELTSVCTDLKIVLG